MAKALVVVESPSKAKTINKYLGSDYKVVASVGHVRDLPKSPKKKTADGHPLDEGIDVENGFEPVYEITNPKVVKELKAAAKGVNEIYVATDPDREGEAIGWHLAKLLGTKKRKVSRLMFNEITKSAVKRSLENVGEIDLPMFYAQQARRVIDRLVGYKLSRLLWNKVRRNLSAGRVQSVALRLICDREDEIDAFRSEEYWHVLARLEGVSPPEFEAKLTKKGKNTIKIENESQVKTVLADLEKAEFVVKSVTNKERKKSAAPPFITSKLQQASRSPVRRTMQIAQQLYEGIELPGEGVVGLITYMRTDSTRVSEQAIGDVRDFIGKKYGASFLPKEPIRYRSKKDAQDAHEAIRPTSTVYQPETVRPHLTREQYYLYRLIWNRFVASQMPPATFDDTTVDVVAGDYVLRAKGSVPKFSGWMLVHEKEASEENQKIDTPINQEAEAVTGLLPVLGEGALVALKKLTPEQKFTQPPPRFSEATLVKELEENGIGRPSTYAATIQKVQQRDYVFKIEGRLKPRRLGRVVTKLLVESWDGIVQVEYTREMEELLDKIESGANDYVDVLTKFYEPLINDIVRLQEEMPDIRGGVPTGGKCPECKKAVLEKPGKFGMFLTCSAYPECTYTGEIGNEKELADEAEKEPCENCGKPMVLKRGRFGQFLACTAYPDCKTTRKLISTSSGMAAAKPDRVLEEKCPKCDSNLVVKQGQYGEFTACTNYPKCRYIKHKSMGITCPLDGGDIVERKSKRGRSFYGCSNYPDCNFTVWNKPVDKTCPKCKAPLLVEKVTKRWGRQQLCHKDDCDYIRTEEELAAV
jgi:DNA topoisomerase-1